MSGLQPPAERAAAPGAAGAPAPRLERDCPLCGLDNHVAPPSRYSIAEWPLKRCRRCGFVYVETAPTYAAQSSTLGWDKTFVDWRAARGGLAWQGALSSAGRGVRQGARVLRQRRRMEDLIARHAPPGSVLDVGCGKGSQLARLPAQYRPFGIEISPVQARHAEAIVAERGGAILCQPAVDGLFALPEGAFTGVMMRSYLEHEIDPARALAGAHRVLTEGGVLIVKVPNYASLNRRVFGSRWCGFRFPDHLNYFTPASLHAMCRAAGFEVREFGFFDRLPTSDNMWLTASRE